MPEHRAKGDEAKAKQRHGAAVAAFTDIGRQRTTGDQIGEMLGQLERDAEDEHHRDKN